MRDTDLYARILGVDAPWGVDGVDLDLPRPGKLDGEVRVHVKWTSSTKPPCPCCGKPAPRYDTRERSWRHLDTCQYRTIPVADIPRVECPEHGVRQIDTPWADPKSRFTALFEAVIIDWLREASIAAVARLLDVTWDECDGVMSRAVARGLARRKLEPAPRTGVDETSFQKRHEYVTVVSDLDASEVLYVADGRSAKSLDGYFKQLSEDQIGEIEVVCMDMSAGYIKSARKHLPDPDRQIAFDRFHVAKLLTDAVDRVRRIEQKKLRADGDERLTRRRYDFLRNPHGMSTKQWERAKEVVHDPTLKTARAWRLKEAATYLWGARSRATARQQWRHWLGKAQRSRLEPIVKAGRTIRKHLDGIVTAVVERATNAGAEAINARIQRVKRMACGYRNRDRFRAAIYFHVGGLSLYPDGITHTRS